MEDEDAEIEPPEDIHLILPEERAEIHPLHDVHEIDPIIPVVDNSWSSFAWSVGKYAIRMASAAAVKLVNTLV